MTWAGRAAPALGWNIDSNWLGFLQPANDTTGTVSLANAGSSIWDEVASVLDADRQIGGLTVTGETGTHTIDLSGNTLIIAGNVMMGDQLVCPPTTFTNGTLQLGIPETETTTEKLVNVTIGQGAWSKTQGQASLIVDNATFAGNLDTVYVPRGYSWSPATTCALDLSNATIANDTFKAKNLWVGHGTGASGWQTPASRGYLRLPATGLTDFVVTNSLNIGANNGVGRIGLATGQPSPNDYKLPENVNVSLGVWPDEWSSGTRCNVNLAAISDSNLNDGALVASGGGTFSGYLGTVETAREGVGGWRSYATLDVRAMDSATIDVLNVNISTYVSANATATEDSRVYLPAGEVTAQNTRICNETDERAVTVGLLQLHGTHYMVTDLLSIGPRGVVNVFIDGESNGLDIADSATVTVLGKINIDFGSWTPAEGIYWGLRWDGNHENELNGLRAAGKLTGNDTLLGGPTWGVFYDNNTDATYVTVMEAWPPKAVAKDITLEVAPGFTTVVFAAEDVDNGSFDPSGGEIVSWVITSVDDEDADPDTITFSALGEHQVQLTVTNDLGAQDSTFCTATVAQIAGGVDTGLTWTNGASNSQMVRQEWFWGMNWSGGAPPAEPTPGVLAFANAGTVSDDAITNILDADRTIGGLSFTGTSGNHKTDLATHTLAIAGPVGVGVNTTTKFSRLVNGNVQIGTPDLHQNLLVGGSGDWSDTLGQGTLVISGGEFTPYLALCGIAYSAPGGPGPILGTLDLQEATVGTFHADTLIIGRNAPEGYIKVSEATGLTDIAIRDSLQMAISGGIMRFGDPNNSYMLPAGVNLTLGEWGVTRCNVTLAQHYTYDSRSDAQIIASSGGTCTAYLGTLRLGHHQGGDQSWAANGYSIGKLDISAMDSVTMDATSIEIAAAPPIIVGGHNDGRGTLILPTGTVTAGDVIVAHPDANATNSDPTLEGVLRLNGTDFTVSSSLTVGPFGKIYTTVKGASCGLDIPASATVAITGTMDILFEADPAGSGLYYGLKWEGDHAAELQALADAGKLTWDASALADPDVSIFVKDGVTYVGQTPPAVTITAFTAADATSGSMLVTNDATVNVSIVAQPAEGETIVGYVINETGVEPTDGWQASLASYTIQAASGSSVTLYAFAKDTAGNVGSASTAIYFNTAAPAVSNVVVTDNGDGTATVTWDTDILAEGSAKYGPVSLSGATPSTAAEAALATSHSVAINIATGTNYKLLLVNNEVTYGPIYWPSPWPIEGDANMDCRVNILDLISIRNKLNQPVGTGDNWKADVNQDTRINILDLIFVRNKLNTQCP